MNWSKLLRKTSAYVKLSSRTVLQRSRFSLYLALLLCSSALLLLVENTSATETPGEVPKRAGIESKLGKNIDLSLTFTDRANTSLALADHLRRDRPTLVAPVYFRCPSLCTLTLNGLVDVLNKLDLKIGTDFNLVAISINPKETSSDASAKAAAYFEQLNKAESEKERWKFLTGSQENIDKTMNQLGFKYEKDGEDYMHAAALMLLTPEGEISRYFYGVVHDPKDMRLSLVEASKGKIGSAVDQLLLYCFRFDPTKGKYSLVVWRIAQIFSIAMFLILVFSLILLRRSEKTKKIETTTE